MKRFIAYAGLLLSAHAAFCQIGDSVVISGYVKYHDGDIVRPAIGSEIFILDFKKTPGDLRFTSIDSVLQIRQLLSRTTLSEDQRETLLKFKVSSVNDLSFKKMEKRAIEQCLRIIHDKNTLTTSVDSTGWYSIRTPPGGYWLVIKSKCHSSFSLSGIGSVYRQFVFASPEHYPKLHFIFPRIGKLK